MSATVRQFVVTDEQLEGVTASFATLEVPNDYPATLTAVEDYDNTHKGGQTGWVLSLRVEGLPFKYWISHSEASRWKLVETVEAFEPGFFDNRAEDGTTRPIDINKYVGQTVGAHVRLDENLDTPRKIVDSLFSLEAALPEVEDVAVL